MCVCVCVILLQLVVSTLAPTLIPSHKGPVVWGPTAQIADDNSVLQAPGLSIKCSSPFSGFHPVGSME